MANDETVSLEHLATQTEKDKKKAPTKNRKGCFAKETLSLNFKHQTLKKGPETFMDYVVVLYCMS
jgi:hypothetical protein